MTLPGEPRRAWSEILAPLIAMALATAVIPLLVRGVEAMFGSSWWRLGETLMAMTWMGYASFMIVFPWVDLALVRPDRARRWIFAGVLPSIGLSLLVAAVPGFLLGGIATAHASRPGVALVLALLVVFLVVTIPGLILNVQRRSALSGDPRA